MVLASVLIVIRHLDTHKKMLVPIWQLLQEYLQPNQDFSFTIWRNNLFDFIFNLNLVSVFIEWKFGLVNLDDMAPLACDYYSLITLITVA